MRLPTWVVRIRSVLRFIFLRPDFFIARDYRRAAKNNSADLWGPRCIAIHMGRRFRPAPLIDQKLGRRGPRAGPAPGPVVGLGFIGNSPSRCMRLRASLRARRIASAFSRAFFSEGFS